VPEWVGLDNTIKAIETKYYAVEEEETNRNTQSPNPLDGIKQDII
jgi:hypothetical protein